MGRCRLGHDGKCRAEPGKGRHDARSVSVPGLWPLLVIVLTVAAGDPPAVSAGNGGEVGSVPAGAHAITRPIPGEKRLGGSPPAG